MHWSPQSAKCDQSSFSFLSLALWQCQFVKNGGKFSRRWTAHFDQRKELFRCLLLEMTSSSKISTGETSRKISDLGELYFIATGSDQL